MKNSVLLIIFLFLTVPILGQKKSKTLLTIDGEKITVEDFKRVYEKNLDVIDNEESKDVAKNLELFINYKLKVKEAYQLQLDTLPSYKREIETYKNQLSAPYLQDTTFIEDLVKEVYKRTKNEVKAKHILVRIPRDATPKDTLVAYKKITKIRNRIVNGEDFEEVAVVASEDNSAKDDLKSGRKGNKGNLGYFSAFDMVLEFEDKAYKTKVGEVSEPFRTQFGYHILKVDDKRPSLGEVQVAHLLIADTTAVGKKKIDDVYAKLKNNGNFEALVTQYSEDENSKKNGGKLRKFRKGRMLKPIEEAAFSLKNVGDYAAPVKTRFGWHIIQLVEKFPIKPFNELKKELGNKIKRSSRMQLSEIAVINKLKAKYTITENEEAKKILNRKNIRAIPKDSLQNVILTINDKEITQESFINYIRNRRHKPVYLLFDMFKNEEILSYYKENLVHTEPEYAYTLKEYEDGLLLFELMQQKIWNASSKDTLGLKNYFEANKNKYPSKELKNNKGEVMNDYQNFLEKNWIADLRKKSEIKINKKQLRKLIKFYEEK
ncbi:peptidylprolyl isomerase [Polaribacter batillariae]|uniref:Peptidylprolyl isomerase n=1 Tax=Polaribacter batillariae TaxID=2808900 RepID=A0ABX7T029_9FLAO|nr:peptidylprolyl isomerase [Polaribacter batillariae]QTD38384.1 peptidylprolyl isomerase [Polaribacter batillariae]